MTTYQELDTIEDYIEYYGKRLKFSGTLTPSYLMFELMNDLRDSDIEDMNTDIVEISDKVLTYIENGGRF